MKSLVPWKRKGESHELRKGSDNPFEALHRSMNELFEGFFDEFGLHSPSKGFEGGLVAGAFSPKFEIAETDSEIALTAELPGIDGKGVEVSLDGDVLRISGERKEEKEEKKKSYHLSEISYGSFSREFRLPAEVVAGKASAKFSKGVLKVSLPKTEKSKEKSKRIQVEGE